MSIREKYVKVREAAAILGVTEHGQSVGSHGKDFGIPASGKRIPALPEVRP